MPKEFTFSPKLKLVIAHLPAVRALNEYVSGFEMKKDIGNLSSYLRQELSQSVLRPAGWTDLTAEKGVLYSGPKVSDGEGRTKWQVSEGAAIKLAVEVPSPADQDYEPYVELWIPDPWDKRDRFIAEIERFKPHDFVHVSDDPIGANTTTTSIFKYIPYAGCIEPDGEFNGARFIDSFREAATALVKLEAEIDGILARLD